MLERRRSPRFACRLDGVLEGPRGRLRGVCTDLSLGGLSFTGVPPLPIGTRVRLTLEPPGQPRLEVDAEVRHQGPGGALGLMFVRLELAPQQALSALLAELERRPAGVSGAQSSS